MTEPIHIVRVDIESVHRLTMASFELDPGGRLIRVVGDNGAGKSSLMRAYRALMGGGRAVLPDVVNDQSEDGTGFVKIEFSNGWRIEKSFTEKAPKGRLRVISPDGGAYKQSKLNEWLGENHDFDIASFFDLDDARQCEIVLGLAADPSLVGRLSESRANRARLEAERTPHNSTVQKCQRTKPPEGERPEAIDVSAEMDRLDELSATNAARAAIDRSIENKIEARKKLNRERASAAIQIADLEAKLAQWRASLEAIETDIVANTGAIDAHSHELAGMPDVAEEMEATRARIDEADDVNKALEPFKAYDRTLVELAESQNASANLTRAIGRALDEERAMMVEAGIPIEGLTVDPDEFRLLLNGHPLAVASGGERIDLALDVAEAKDPALKVVLVEEGNDLGMRMLAEIDEKARARGFQVFVCRLDGPGEILVVDGVATARPAADRLTGTDEELFGDTEHDFA
jgi:hypothetical protein